MKKSAIKSCCGVMTSDEVVELQKQQKKYKSQAGFLDHILDLSSIDINFTINVLKTILRECQCYKYNHGCEPLYRSLTHSISRLLSMLEVERDNIVLSNLPK